MLQLYNTLTRKKEPFEPINKDEVGLYTCGLTVYNFAHIGNLRTYLFEDVLKRTLKANRYNVKHVMNITDVGHLTSDADDGEDKMEKSAKREGKTAVEIAEYYTKEFKQDLKDLNIEEPDIWAKATDHIQEQIDWISKLEEKGATYKTSDGIYFDTSTFADYGKLTGQKLEDLKEGARVEKNKEKKNPTDFALWKFSPKVEKRQMEWDSPWGTGFPGWHIECSAMAQKYLGETFDIHCGGIDHIPIHHTNEIAQAEAVTGKQFVKYWLHGEFLVIGNDEKMAKSEENFVTLRTLKQKGISPLAYRFFTLGTHYRQKLNFSWEALEAAQKTLENLYVLTAELGEPKIGCAEFEERFHKAVNDDLNIPKGLAILWELLKSDYPPEAKKASVLKFDEILGLDFKKSKKRKKIITVTSISFPTTTTPPPPNIKKEVRKLQKERDVARKNGEWDKADKLRKEIENKGFQLRDIIKKQEK